MDFRHVEHVGFDPDTGFDTNALNSKFVKFFEKVFINVLIDRSFQYLCSRLVFHQIN